MGKSRKAWQEIKSQIEDAWGASFVKAQFKLDLGPGLDKLEQDIATLAADMKKLEKLAEELHARKEKLRSRRHETYATLDTYGKVVKQKSKQEKTQHGTQWDKVDQIITGAIDAEVAVFNNAVEAAISKLKVAGWNK